MSDDPRNASAPLSLSREEMRRAGYRVVDVIVEHFMSRAQKPAIRKLSPGSLSERLHEDAPSEPSGFDSVLEKLESEVFTQIAHTDHPRFFAFVPSPNNFVSVLADTLSSGFNVFCGHWHVGSAAAAIELETIGWMTRLMGYAEGAGGLFLSGGSAANAAALATARSVKLGAHREDTVIYASSETHTSLHKAVRFLGFSDDRLRVIDVDSEDRLPVGELVTQIAADRDRGLRPLCVVANAGTTSTGAVDPLESIAAVCLREDLWLHVDGAYGASAMLDERGRRLLRGLSKADSITLDPHKWWFQPFETATLLVKDRSHLRRAFSLNEEGSYLRETRLSEGEFNFYEHGPQLTRSFRALKLWMSIRVFGLDAFRAAVRHGFDLAEFTEARLVEESRWEIVTPARMGIVTFRYLGEADGSRGDDSVDTTNLRIVELLTEEGFAMVSSTTHRGRPVLRMCTIHPETTQQDIDQTLRRIATLGRKAMSSGRGRGDE